MSLLSGELLGSGLLANDENTFSKAEVKSALDDKTLSSLLKPSGVKHKTFIAYDLLEDSHGALLEDSDGMVHVISIGALTRTGVDFDMLNSLEHVDLDTSITKSDFDFFDLDGRCERAREYNTKIVNKIKADALTEDLKVEAILRLIIKDETVSEEVLKLTRDNIKNIL